MRTHAELKPNRAYELFRKKRALLSTEEFFNDPAAGYLRDLWVAAHFGRAYEQNFAGCSLIFDDSRTHEWDFVLKTQGEQLPFQVTEALEPGRRRGREYRETKNDDSSVVETESWDLGTQMGPEWIRSAIERKRKKNYAGASALNLLVYANFPAYQLEFATVRVACRVDAHAFRSVWVITGNLLGIVACDSTFAGNGPFGWRLIAPSLR